ncbi:hypothetical protein BH10PSE9_BH10PSE9_15060 [soil metagenome]
MTVAVLPTLSAISTSVLLEQEDWFEKEVTFLDRFLAAGMSAIDIGANIGVYSLRMARLVASTGSVFAYEPGSEARGLLELSRNLNGFLNLTISNAALSEASGQGRLSFSTSSELRSLVGDGTGEQVPVTTLDDEDARLQWRSPDFVKIDAEGAEEQILRGGPSFFARHSPLVMFERKNAETSNDHLRSAFRALGYETFRQLGAAPVLVPIEDGETMDSYELNLFAAKPDRVKTMAAAGLLVERIPDWQPDNASRQLAPSHWREQSFSSAVADRESYTTDPDYVDALAAYAIWQREEHPLPVRCAALRSALRSMSASVSHGPTPERLSTFARIAFEWGARSVAVGALARFFDAVEKLPALDLREAFWPASPRFDRVPLGDRPGNWLVGAAAEQLERLSAFSTAFKEESPMLRWLCERPFASAEMLRRRVLYDARAGRRPRVPPRLCEPAEDHLNAAIWRSGGVPGTTTS